MAVDLARSLGIEWIAGQWPYLDHASYSSIRDYLKKGERLFGIPAKGASLIAGAGFMDLDGRTGKESSQSAGFQYCENRLPPRI